MNKPIVAIVHPYDSSKSFYTLRGLNEGKYYSCLLDEGNGYTCFLKVDPLFEIGSKY